MSIVGHGATETSEPTCRYARVHGRVIRQDVRVTDAAADVPLHDVRQFLADIKGTQFVGYTTRDEAEADPDAAVVLSGDYGGTIFLTAPLRLVSCDTETLLVLVSDLDAVTWMSGDLTIATVAFERHAVGEGVTGGDGGGLVLDGVWTHPRGLPSVVGDQATEVVLGSRSRIDGDVLRDCRQRELDRKKAWREAQPTMQTKNFPSGLPWDFDISPPDRDFPA